MSFLSNVRDWFNSVAHHPGYIIVKVVDGDNLWDICKHASGLGATNAEIQHRVDEVKALNPTMDPALIHPGDEIRLPVEWDTNG